MRHINNEKILLRGNKNPIQLAVLETMASLPVARHIKEKYEKVGNLSSEQKVWGRLFLVKEKDLGPQKERERETVGGVSFGSLENAAELAHHDTS